MQNQKELHKLHAHIEYNAHDIMQNHTAAEQQGYEHDQECLSDFDHAEGDISFTTEVEPTDSAVESDPPALDNVDGASDQRKDRLSFSSDSEQENLKRCVEPILRKRKSFLAATQSNVLVSTEADTCGVATTSEEDSNRFGAMLRIKGARSKQANNKPSPSFSRDLEFTTTEGSEIEVPVSRKRLLSTLAECTDDETDQDLFTAPDSRELQLPVAPKALQTPRAGNQTRAMAAASSDEERTFRNKRTPEYLRQQVRSKKQSTSTCNQAGLKLRIAVPLSINQSKTINYEQDEPLSSIPEEMQMDFVRHSSNTPDEETSPSEQVHNEIPQQQSSTSSDSTIDSEIEAQNRPVEQEDNPTKGVIFMVLSTIFMVIANTLSKEQFELSPMLGVLELIFARGVISIVMLLCWVNKNAKTELIDKIEASSLPALIFRCVSGGIVQIISFQSIKYFNVSTVGMVCSLAPIIVCGLAYFLLGERMGRADVLFFVAVFCSCTMVLLGARNENSGNNEVAEAVSVVAFICLITQPVLIAGQVIANRTMRKMSEVVVSTYVQVTLTVVIGLLMAVQGASFTFLTRFSAMSWFLLIASSIVNILSSTTKFLACKYHTASDLQKLAFLPNVWQFGIDITFMKATFGGLELAGFVALFVFYGVYLGALGAQSCLKNKTEAELSDEFKSQCDLEQGDTTIDTHKSKSTWPADNTEQNLLTSKKHLQVYLSKTNRPSNQQTLLNEDFPRV